MNNKPEWLKNAPEWFKEFYSNDFAHFSWKIDWSWRLQLLILAAIIGGAIAIVCNVI